MDICGEHGDDIAYSGRDCPACEQIESIVRDHQEEVNNITSDFEQEISDMQDRIDELESNKE